MSRLPERPLREEDLGPDPLAEFERWYAQAREAGEQQPDAMALATASPDGRPSNRMVLLKGVDGGGLTFFSNYESAKGLDLAANRGPRRSSSGTGCTGSCVWRGSPGG